MVSLIAKLQLLFKEGRVCLIYFNIKFVALIVLIRFICMSKMAIINNYY